MQKNNFEKKMADFIRNAQKQAKDFQQQLSSTDKQKSGLSLDLESLSSTLKNIKKDLKKTSKQIQKTTKSFEKIDMAEIKPGTYMISFTAVYKVKVYRWTGKKNNSVYLQKEKLIDAPNIKISKKVNKRTFLMNLADKVLEEEFKGKWSEWYLEDVKNIFIVPLTKVDLMKRKMKGATLAYKFLGNIEKINKNPGQCVIDYLVYECQVHNRMKHWTRPKLIKYFGESCLLTGISTEDIIRWARESGYVNVFALDPFMETFTTYTCPMEVHSNMTLCFIMNNDHCYAILDKQQKFDIARKHHIDLGDFMFDIKYDDYDYIKTKTIRHIMDRLKNATNQKKIVLLENDDLCELASELMIDTDTMIINTKFSGSRLVAFEHPTTKQILIAAEDHDERKAVCEAMYQEIECEQLKFNNQSWTQLATIYYSLKYGEIKPSTYGPDLLHIFKEYRLAPYITVMKECFKDKTMIGKKPIKSFDIRRDYTGIFINNDTKYNVFSDFDYIVPFDGNLTEGEYYINTTIHLGGNTIRKSRGFYPYIFVKYLLEVKAITLDNLKYIIRPSYLLPADQFKGFAQEIYDKWTETGAKPLNNCFIGELNKQSLKITKGCATDQFETACGIMWNQETKGQPARIFRVGEMFFIRSDIRTALTKGHVPIWRHIIASSYIELDKLYRKVVGPKSIVVAYNTDSIKLVDPLNIELSDNPKPGEIREEETCKVRGTPIDDLQLNPEYIYVKKEFKKIDETKGSCLTIGMPGAGKTVDAKKNYDDKTIAFTFTNKASDVLKDRGVDNCHTFDSFFCDHQHERPLQKLASYEKIIVDEFSMVPSKWYTKLMQIKMMYPKMIIRLYGDCNQCKPIEDMWYDYMTNPLIMYLVDYNLRELEYKFTRYDKALYDILIYFLKHQKLPESCRNKKEKNCYINLCYHNHANQKMPTEKIVNAECLRDFCKEKKIKSQNINGLEVAIGVPIIATVNNKKYEVYTSQMYQIVEINDDVVKIKKEDKVKEIPSEDLPKLFRLGFCVTVYKYQGDEIKTDYTIYEANNMSFNEMYTALSRGVSLDKVHFKFTDKVFKRDIPPTDPITLKTSPKTKYLDGKIYMIADDKKTWIYIGSTIKELEERLKEHKLKPANKFLKEVIHTGKISLVKEVPCLSEKDLLEIEDNYIRKFTEEGYNVINVKMNIKTQTDKNLKVQIVQDVHIRKFNINDNEKKKLYFLRYTEDGKYKQKEFRYAKCGKEVAMIEAKKFQDELMKKFY
jgi:hypothetical protein